MVDDGGCSYETKARNIEQMGASAAIVILDKPVDVELEGATEDLMQLGVYDGTG